MEGREGGGGRAFSGEIEEGGRKKNDGRPRAPGRGRRRASMSRHRIVHPRANTAFAWTYAIGITRGCAVASIASGAQRAAASGVVTLRRAVLGLQRSGSVFAPAGWLAGSGSSTFTLRARRGARAAHSSTRAPSTPRVVMTRSRRPKASPPDPSAAPAAATLGDVLAAEPALACVVFSFLPNPRDRCALARVGRVFRDADARVASLPAAFDFAGYDPTQRGYSGDVIKYLMRHDGVLSLPKARVEELLASVTPRLPGKIYTSGQTGVQPTSEKAEHFCGWAAHDGELELLKWLREHEYPWGDTCRKAAQRGHLHVLEWARENGAPWDATVCSGAAYSGHLHVLKWARANGAPWDENTTISCVLGDQMETLVWAIEQGALVDNYVYHVAVTRGHHEIAEYVVLHVLRDLNTTE